MIKHSLNLHHTCVCSKRSHTINHIWSWNWSVKYDSLSMLYSHDTPACVERTFSLQTMMPDIGIISNNSDAHTVTNEYYYYNALYIQSDHLLPHFSTIHIWLDSFSDAMDNLCNSTCLLSVGECVCQSLQTWAINSSDIEFGISLLKIE